MEFIQSTKQALFNRAYLNMGSVAMSILAMMVVALFGKAQENFWVPLVVVIAIPILITLWLLLFNSGRSKMSELTLVIDDNGINLYSLGRWQKLSWESYQEYNF